MGELERFEQDKGRYRKTAHFDRLEQHLQDDVNTLISEDLTVHLGTHGPTATLSMISTDEDHIEQFLEVILAAVHAQADEKR